MNYKFITVLILIFGLYSCETPLESDVQKDFQEELPDSPIIPDSVDVVSSTIIEYYGNQGQRLIGLDWSAFHEIDYEEITLDTTSNKLILNSEGLTISRIHTGFEAEFLIDFTHEIRIKFNDLDLRRPLDNYSRDDIEIEIDLMDLHEDIHTYSNGDLEFVFVNYPRISNEVCELFIKVRILEPQAFIQEFEMKLLMIFEEDKFFD